MADLDLGKKQKKSGAPSGQKKRGGGRSVRKKHYGESRRVERGGSLAREGNG